MLKDAAIAEAKARQASEEARLLAEESVAAAERNYAGLGGRPRRTIG